MPLIGKGTQMKLLIVDDDPGLREALGAASDQPARRQFVASS